MLNKQLTKLCKGRTPSPKRFENIVKELLETKGLVARGDYKNHMPDWLFFEKGWVTGVECKRYATVSSLEAAVNKWKTNQRGQYESFKVIKKHIPIFVVFYLKTGVYNYQL